MKRDRVTGSRVSGQYFTRDSVDSGLSPNLQNSLAAESGKRLVEMDAEEFERFFDQLILLVEFESGVRM